MILTVIYILIQLLEGSNTRAHLYLNVFLTFLLSQHSATFLAFRAPNLT